MLPNIVILKVQHYLSNVCRYNWRQFAVVTSDIAGHDDFVQAVREEVITMREERNIKWADRHFYNLLNIYTSFLTRKNGNLSKTALLHESMLLEFFCIYSVGVPSLGKKSIEPNINSWEFGQKVQDYHFVYFIFYTF